MHPFRVSLMGAFAALAVVSSVRADPTDESLAQQKKVDYECRQWAAQHTGFDPKAPTPSEPPRRIRSLDPVPRGAGDALLQAARRRDDALARKKQREEQEAELESRRAKYERAVKTCLEGRQATPVTGK